MASLYIPFWITGLYIGTWIFSEKWCDIQAVIAGTLATASTLNMALIAFNRYIRVVKPALYGTIYPNKRIALFYCVVVWIVVILFTTPPLYGWGKLVYHPIFTTWTFDWNIENISYTIVIMGGVANGATIAQNL